jgi:hypothetical protein
VSLATFGVNSLRIWARQLLKAASLHTNQQKRHDLRADAGTLLDLPVKVLFFLIK